MFQYPESVVEYRFESLKYDFFAESLAVNAERMRLSLCQRLRIVAKCLDEHQAALEVFYYDFAQVLFHYPAGDATVLRTEEYYGSSDRQRTEEL